jgi:predicted DNA-binding transcriptional regulator AlpA
MALPENRRINSAAVRELCGGVSDMSLWRWLQNPDLNFPKPVYIGKRRYFKEADVVAWLEAQPETVK